MKRQFLTKREAEERADEWRRFGLEASEPHTDISCDGRRVVWVVDFQDPPQEKA